MVHLDEAGRGLEWTVVRRPPPRLRSWVEHTWIQRFPPSWEGSTAWKIVPDPSPNLLIHQTGRRRFASLVGPRTRAIDVGVQNREWTVGIRFRPGVLPDLAKLTGGDLTDRSASLSDAFGPAARDIEDGILSAAGPEKALAVVMRFIDDQTPGGYRPDWKVRLVLAADPAAEGLRVGALARHAGISRRALQMALVERVGLSPKATLSIRRLYRALQTGLSSVAPDWSRIAVEAGYHDGAHLARCFRRRIGESPTAWRARARADSYNR